GNRGGCAEPSHSGESDPGSDADATRRLPAKLTEGVKEVRDVRAGGPVARRHGGERGHAGQPDQNEHRPERQRAGNRAGDGPASARRTSEPSSSGTKATAISASVSAAAAGKMR